MLTDKGHLIRRQSTSHTHRRQGCATAGRVACTGCWWGDLNPTELQTHQRPGARGERGLPWGNAGRGLEGSTPEPRPPGLRLEQTQQGLAAPAQGPSSSHRGSEAQKPFQALEELAAHWNFWPQTFLVARVFQALPFGLWSVLPPHPLSLQGPFLERPGKACWLTGKEY